MGAARGGVAGPARGATWCSTTVSLVVLAMLAAWPRPVAALNARLGWSRVGAAAGYRVYVRQSGQAYGSGTDVGLIQADATGVVYYVAPSLPTGVLNYFAVTAYDGSGRESALSNELSLLVNATPTATRTATVTAPAPFTSTMGATAIRTATANAVATATSPAASTATLTRTITTTLTRTVTATPTRTVTPTPTSSPIGTAVAGSSPLAAYAFSEGSGTTTADASGNGHTGTLFGNARWVTGAYGIGLQFGGGSTRDGVNLAPNNGFDGLLQGTLEAWVRFDTSAPAGVYNWFDGRDASGCSYPFEVGYNNRSGTVIYWEVWAGDGPLCSATFYARLAVTNPDQWHHLAYVVSGTGNTWYVDGVARTPTYLNGSAASTFFLANIAASPNTRYDVGTSEDPLETFEGTVDELRIYGRPLTGAEIQADMIAPVGAPPVRTSTASVTPTATPIPTVAGTPIGTATRTIAPGSPFDVSGAIRYYAGAKPVANTELTLQRTQSALTASSDGLGQFGFTGVPADTWRLEPRKNGDFQNAISSRDASYVLQVVAGKRTFDALQQLACDVTGDGTLSSLDATRILDFAVGTITRMPVAERCGSDWVFVPQPASVPGQRLVMPAVSSTSCQRGAIAFEPLQSDAPQQDFSAALFGDCTGNWKPPKPLAALRRSAGEVRLGTARGRPGGRWIVPLYASGGAVEALAARVAYDPAAAALEIVRPVGTASGALLRYRADTSGVVVIALASDRPFSAEDRLAVLVFRAAEAPRLRLLGQSP